MNIRSVDGNNDWNFGKGLSDYASEELAIEENIKTRLLSWFGDCFFAPDEGIDWRSRLDVGQQDALLTEVKTMILQTEGVVGINSVTGVFDSTQRTYAIAYSVQTIYSRSLQSSVLQMVN